MVDGTQINRNNNFQTFPQAVLLLFRYERPLAFLASPLYPRQCWYHICPVLEGSLPGTVPCCHRYENLASRFDTGSLLSGKLPIQPH